MNRNRIDPRQLRFSIDRWTSAQIGGSIASWSLVFLVPWWLGREDAA